MRDGHQRTGVAETIEESSKRDLLVFSLYDPPARSPAEIAEILGSSARPATVSENPLQRMNIVLVASKQDHGPGQHDYPAWQKKWTPLLRRVTKVTVSEAWEWPSPEQWGAADVVVFYCWNHDWSAERYGQLDEYQARGGGLALFHAATIADQQPEALAERIGLAAQPGPTKYLHSPILLNFVARTGHPVASGFKRLNLIDEPYWPMFGDTNRIEILAAADLGSQARPLIWTFKKGKGRVFANILGHYTWTWDDPLFRALALRGVSWAAGRPVDRLEIRD
jgi:type 1 glutamine amidotransferase